ncbi:hypothetical protein CHUAL_005240 [Chamberlinius hualienensis]
MLKQWFLGRKKKSSKYFHFSGQQRRRNKNQNTFPLADSCLIFRTNPVYIDEIGNYANVINGQPLHVHSWCSLICPLHLSTTCSCKPTLIYCDSCKPPFNNNIHSIDNFHQTPELDLLRIQPPIYENYIKMLPSPLNYTDNNMENAITHYYQFVERKSLETQTQSENTQIYLQSNLSDTQPQSNDLERQLQADLVSLKPSKQHLHIYMNSDFVSKIAVPTAIHVQPLVDSLDPTSGRELTEQFKVVSSSRLNDNGQISSTNLLQHNFAENYQTVLNDNSQLDSSFVTHETDSLESLHIDERLFAVNDQPDNNWNKSSIKVKSEDEFELPENVAHENSTYEAVKDLYEKLSNSRERQMVEHAINSSYSGTAHSSMLTSHSSSSHGSGKKFKNFVGNTYETLTKHVRHSYAKLVEEDSTFFKNNSDLPEDIFHINVSNVNSSALSQMNLQSTYIDDGHESRRSSASRKLPTTSSAAKGMTPVAPDDDLVTVHSQTEEVTSNQNNQFITKRDPKYGPQIDQAMTLRSPTKKHLCQNLRKIFRQKQYRDACKIIITTLIGLTAFGIITALSLSINRR